MPKKYNFLVLALLVLVVPLLWLGYTHNETRAQNSSTPILTSSSEKEAQQLDANTSDIVDIQLKNGTKMLYAKHLKVMFGSNEAQVLNRTGNTIKCIVPPSSLEGIGWNVTVSINVCNGNKCEVAVPATLTYPAANPPTRVANLGLLWITDTRSTVPKVIQMFVDRLGPDWRFQFFVFPQAMDFVAQLPVAKQLKAEGRLVITEQEAIDVHGYASQNIDPEYWKRIEGDRILVFQLDSAPCSGSRHNITEFFDYDYVGAPWYFRKTGGNGGLSLRNRTALIRLLEENSELIKSLQNKQDWRMEDVAIGLPKSCTLFTLHYSGFTAFFIFCVCVLTADMALKTDYFRLAPYDVAQHFSVEQVYYDRPWGLHQVWIALGNKKLVSLLEETCPELKTIKPPPK